MILKSTIACFSSIGSKHIPGAATLQLVNMSINLFEVYTLLFSIKEEVKQNPFRKKKNCSNIKIQSAS
jgi:hypothetical protein